MGRDNSTVKKTMKKDEKWSEKTGESSRTRIESAPVPDLSKGEQSSHLATNVKANSSKQQADLSAGSKDQKQKSGSEHIITGLSLCESFDGLKKVFSPFTNRKTKTELDGN